jgi:hypothetical protein
MFVNEEGSLGMIDYDDMAFYFCIHEFKLSLLVAYQGQTPRLPSKYSSDIHT